MGLKKDIAIEEAAKTGGGFAVEGDDIDDSDLRTICFGHSSARISYSAPSTLSVCSQWDSAFR